MWQMCEGTNHTNFVVVLQQKKREQRDDDIRANIKAFHGGLTRFGRNS